jgi:hypothetical protein
MRSSTCEQDINAQPLDQRQLHLRGSFGQPGTEAQLRGWVLWGSLVDSGSSVPR